MFSVKTPILILSLLLGFVPAYASEPVIAIIIDDLGQQRRAGLAATDLPGPVACSVLPHTPWAAEIADSANQAGKEVMLHLPLQAMAKDSPASSGQISLDTSRDEMSLLLTESLNSVPHVVGINNHMGSLITRHPGHMNWLMEDIAAHGGLFFIDSYTTAQSVGLVLAVEHGIPAARRNVFLDADNSEAAIREQFERLIRLAKRDGRALAIGHPYPDTLKVLSEELPELSQRGVKLLSIAEYLALTQTPAAAQTAGNIVSPALPN